MRHTSTPQPAAKSTNFQTRVFTSRILKTPSRGSRLNSALKIPR